MIQAIIDYWAMKKAAGRAVYDTKVVFGLSMIVVVISLVSNMLYRLYAIRYVIIGVILTIVFFFRRKIVSMFMELKLK